MKVIGHITNDKYICEVKHEELEKFLNLYYNKKDKMKPKNFLTQILKQ